MQNLRKEPHPVEVLLVGALLALEAAAVLVVAVAALALTLLQAPPAAATAPAPAPPAPPAEHPLAVVAESLVAELEPCTVAELRRRARAAGLPRSLSRSGCRDQLLSTLAGLEVALS